MHTALLVIPTSRATAVYPYPACRRETIRFFCSVVKVITPFRDFLPFSVPNGVVFIIGNDLINKEDRGNVGSETKACKVTYHFADEPNKGVVTEVLRILMNVR